MVHLILQRYADSPTLPFARLEPFPDFVGIEPNAGFPFPGANVYVRNVVHASPLVDRGHGNIEQLRNLIGVQKPLLVSSRGYCHSVLAPTFNVEAIAANFDGLLIV